MRTVPTVAVLAAGLTIAASATGITYAASSGSTGSVHACANSKGTLRLLEHGDCPRHYSKVTINERGPRGPRGERGRRGVPGTPGPGAVSLVVNAATAPTCNPTCWTESDPIAGTGLAVEVLCAPQQEAQVYINLNSAGSVFTVEGDATYSGTGSGNVLWLNAAGDAPVTTNLSSTPTLLSTQQVGDPHSVEFTAPNGSLIADVVVTQDNHVFSVELAEYRDSNTCWAHAMVTPTG